MTSPRTPNQLPNCLKSTTSQRSPDQAIFHQRCLRFDTDGPGGNASPTIAQAARLKHLTSCLTLMLTPVSLRRVKMNLSSHSIAMRLPASRQTQETTQHMGRIKFKGLIPCETIGSLFFHLHNRVVGVQLGCFKRGLAPNVFRHRLYTFVAY